jgi:hypothetical protein
MFRLRRYVLHSVAPNVVPVPSAHRWLGWLSCPVVGYCRRDEVRERASMIAMVVASAYRAVREVGYPAGAALPVRVVFIRCQT